MKKQVRSISLLLMTLFCLGSAGLSHASDPGDDPLQGTWLGKLSVGSTELRIVFHFVPDGSGGYTGTLDSPDQGAKGIKLGAIVLTDHALRVDIPAVAGTYSGTLSAEGGHFDGTWEQGGQSLPLNIDRVTELQASVEPNRPQEPHAPYPYRVEEVKYDSDAAGVIIAGTLTLPEGVGPFPAVLLISGSGPQNRDEAILGHKPFLVLADYLTRHGIAVLRVDDRGVGESTGSFATATSRDFADDVEAGVKFLRGRKEIDAGRVGLIGHSEGGIIAPMVASEMPDVAYIVLLAGPGISGDQILMLQGALISRANGTREALIEWRRALQKQMFERITKNDDEASLHEDLRAIMKAATDTLSEADRTAIGLSDKIIEGQIQQMTSPWFRFFLTYDPAPALRKVKCPVLALNGEKDLQVPPKENLAAIRAALAAGGNERSEIVEFPGLNHLFQHAETGSPGEYSRIEETMSPEVLDRIATWIRAQ